MTFLELAELIITEENKPLTANEIWNIAVKKEYDKKLNSQWKITSATLGALLYVNVKDNPKSIFSKTNSRPKRFYLKNMEGKIDLYENTIPEEPIIKKKKFDFLEKDLHKHLTFYVYYYMQSYTKTINHTISSKKEFGEWVHPDMVGCYCRTQDWKKEVGDFSNAIGIKSIVLYSFEIKREVSFANLRESFFQCVSNSSWANESYLVAARISEDEDFIKELERLCLSFGIGVIELDIEDLHSSDVIIPAKYKKDLDFETINKLAINIDFREFLETVKIDYTTGKIYDKEYEKVLELEELINDKTK